jgi:hypothetical protein
MYGESSSINFNQRLVHSSSLPWYISPEVLKPSVTHLFSIHNLPQVCRKDLAATDACQMNMAKHFCHTLSIPNYNSF